MKRARDSRNFGGRWLWHSKVIGHMIGSLFLRSFYRGERVYLAMLSRGYDGTMPETGGRRFGWGELLFLSLCPVLIFFRIYMR
jgi:cobalt/nickel transport system permease protein